MALDRTSTLLSRFDDRLFLTDGGLETALVFLEGIDLPHFAAFPLYRSPDGRQALERYFNGFLAEAEALGLGFVLDTATWRASAGWGGRMGWSPAEIDAVNRDAVAFARSLLAGRSGDVVINGVIGPHGDAYAPDTVLTPQMAEAYHQRQVAVLAEAGADMLTAVTISSTGEAIGIATAARKTGVPVVLSFTVETDGRLIGGQTLAGAIAETDEATTGYPLWYGINCAHPDHFAGSLSGDIAARIGMVRANASRLSHAELDQSTELDAGDPAELAQDYVRLRQMVPGLRVLGGCCGTDLRHVAAIGRRCAHRH
jgi:S-methylmethionine-dependent homocysteine/selenocysteine methylase